MTIVPRPLAMLLLPLAAVSLLAAPPDPKVPQGRNLEVPEGWSVRLDKERANVVIGNDIDSADIRFVNMTPGWHVTTGPAAIFHHPELRATGDYRLFAEFHLFPPGSRNEAYGIFFGGEQLDGPKIRYDYFLVRNSGEFLVKRRSGADTSLIQPWTASPAIVRHDGKKGSVKNALAVVARGTDVDFVINGTTVLTLPREKVRTEGAVGLRVNHALDLHISDISASSFDK